MVQLKELSPEPVSLVAFIIPHAPEKVTETTTNFDGVVLGCRSTVNQFISTVIVKYQAINTMPDVWEEVEGTTM